MSGTGANDRDASRGATESDERGEVEYLRRAHWEMTQEAAQAKAERDEMFSAALRLKRKHIESHARAEAAEAALASEREAHEGLRALVRLIGLRVSEFCEAVESECDPAADLCHDHDRTDEGGCALATDLEAIATDLLRALAAEPAAPVAAEEGGEQEAGEVMPPPECFNHAHIPWNNWCAPSGSDEQGNRPATPDANGVHDTKGGAS